MYLESGNNHLTSTNFFNNSLHFSPSEFQLLFAAVFATLFATNFLKRLLFSFELLTITMNTLNRYNYVAKFCFAMAFFTLFTSICDVIVEKLTLAVHIIYYVVQFFTGGEHTSTHPIIEHYIRILYYFFVCTMTGYIMGWV